MLFAGEQSLTTLILNGKIINRSGQIINYARDQDSRLHMPTQGNSVVSHLCGKPLLVARPAPYLITSMRAPEGNGL